MRNKALAAGLFLLAVSSIATVWSQADAQQRYRRWNRGYDRDRYESRAILPAGSAVQVRLDERLSTDDNQSGDEWRGTVTHSIVYNGDVMIPAGSEVVGVVSNSIQGSTKPQMSLAMRQVYANGRTYNVRGDTEPIVADSKRARKIGAIAGGAAAGALLGGAVGKGKGAVIGGILGGATGYGVTRHALRTMVLKEGTELTFVTREDVLASRRY